MADAELDDLAMPARPPLGRPGILIGLGVASSAVLAALAAANPWGTGRAFEDVYVVLAAAFVVLALIAKARIPEHQVLDYVRLAASVVLIAAGMVALDIQPWIGQSAAAICANVLFGAGGVLSLTVIMPALYRRMDHGSMTMSLLDGGVIMSAGTTVALTIWRSNQGTSAAQLLMPVIAAALIASTGMAMVAALGKRMEPGFRGVWAAIPAVSILGFAWVFLVDSLLRGGSRDTITSMVFTAGILLIGHGWTTWTDETTDDERYHRLAGLLSDWLPMAAIGACVAADALPHGRIEGVDVIWLGTVGVIFFSLARQRLLISREREISHHLVGVERLRAEKETAEAANRAKSAFLAMMSHEIRTPLNAIMGNATLLCDSELGPAERESVEAIETAGQSLLSVINDVLDFSKIEAERMELERVGFAPATVIHSVVSLFAITAKDKGLTLDSDVDPTIPVILAGDPHRLHQILSNLIGNAIKFTSQGGVTVRARVLHRTLDETRLSFQVADTGMGIDDAARARLFSPFVQVDTSTTRRFGGTGLGLAICKRLVEMMGGQIDVESTAGEGSTFWFTISLAAPTDEEAGGALQAHEYVGRTVDTIGARILVAEDNAANVRLIERMLGRLGIETVCVGTGAAAVAAVRESIFDLVLMDLHMPEMDGLEATHLIRAAGHDIPIVALTANAQGSDRIACLAAGMNDYLSKPVRATDLSAALHRWLPGEESTAAGIGKAAAAAVVAPAAAKFAGVLDQGQMGELLALDPDGSAGFLAAMVESYHATVEETIPLIRRAVATSDWPLLEDAAHKLKGVAANVGIRRVNEFAAKLVTGVRLGDSSNASRDLADLLAALAPADEALATLLAEAPNLSAEVQDAA